MGARNEILDAIRSRQGRSAITGSAEQELLARVGSAQPGPIPAHAKLQGEDRILRFIEQARQADATLVDVVDRARAVDEVARFLVEQNLPARIRLADDPYLLGFPWAERQKTLDVTYGVPLPHDLVGVGAAWAGISETGTVMMLSGRHSPATLNFLPEYHVVVMPHHRIVGSMEDCWAMLRRQCGSEPMPRTVNMITGPSRSADIEMTLQLGAHGPRKLHIIVVREKDEASSDA